MVTPIELIILPMVCLSSGDELKKLGLAVCPSIQSVWVLGLAVCPSIQSDLGRFPYNIGFITYFKFPYNYFHSHIHYLDEVGYL